MLLLRKLSTVPDGLLSLQGVLLQFVVDGRFDLHSSSHPVGGVPPSPQMIASDAVLCPYLLRGSLGRETLSMACSVPR